MNNLITILVSFLILATMLFVSCSNSVRKERENRKERFMEINSYEMFDVNK